MWRTSPATQAEKIPNVGPISVTDQAAPPEYVEVMALERGFQEISATRLGVQTAAQRFGASHDAPVQPPDDSDSEDEQDIEDTQTAPRVEEWRMNLTVLSQHYNLYFAAYGNQIYVYRPQNPQQALPREPDMIVPPPQSREAKRKNLTTRYRGHIINHLVIGNLGDKEILLCSCHDGDVIAYYTQVFENALWNRHNLPSHISIIDFCFHENVGESAWGLAIHSQSRLIAVGSNAHEIQVFAFALSESAYEETSSIGKPRQSKPYLPPGARCVQFPQVKLSEVCQTHGGKVSRDQNFRLVFNLGALGHNIPSVAFSDSPEGDADTIIAIDIRGALWFFRLWEDDVKRLPSIYEPPDPHRNPVGWGLLVLPRDFFKPTHDLADTFGWPKSLSSLLAREGMIDISKTVSKVRDSTVWHEVYDTDTPDEDEDDEDDDEGEDEDNDVDGNDEESSPNILGYQGLDTVLADADFPISSISEEQDTVMNGSAGHIGEIFFTSQQLQTLVDPFTPSPSPPTLEERFLARSGQFIENSKGDDFQLSRSGELILQSYRHSTTLHPTQDDTLPTQCDNLLRQEFTHDVGFPRPLTDYDRLNMLATIPELSLILVASQIGRVALITITRPVQRDTRLGHIVSMRVDLILPFKNEETEKIRPSHGLLGMAVGPMQNERAKMMARGAGEGPRRWRLMLHYFNHTILSYEISREEETGELLVL